MSTFLPSQIPYMELKIFVESTDSDFKEIYIKSAKKHNDQWNQNEFIDAGFDLYVPKSNFNSFNDTATYRNQINKIDHQIKCSATIIDPVYTRPTGYYLFPRSSITKTPLRLANSTGIIDSGYRGNIIGVFDCIDTSLSKETEQCLLKENKLYLVEPYTRLLQICSPTLTPIKVIVVDTMEELGTQTQRGTGGFGSTGR